MYDVRFRQLDVIFVNVYVVVVNCCKGPVTMFFLVPFICGFRYV